MLNELCKREPEIDTAKLFKVGKIIHRRNHDE